MEFWFAISVAAATIAIAAMGLFLQIRSGQMNVGMAVFVGCGGYTAGVLSSAYGLPAILTIPGAMLVGFVAGALFAALTLRLHHWFFAVTTLGLSLAAVATVGQIPILGGPLGLSGIEIIQSPWLVFGALIATTLFVIAFDRSEFGLQVRGMGDDERLAEIFGARIQRLRIMIFGIGSAFAALSGALNAHRYGVYQPADLNFDASLLLFVYIIVGGKRSFFGPLVGVLVLYVLPEAIQIVPQTRLIVFGLLMMFCAAVMPEGIVGAIRYLHGRARAGRASPPAAPIATLET